MFTNKCNLSIIVTNLCEHILGRKGDKQPNQAETELAIALKEYIDKGEFAKPIRGLKRQRIIEECKSIAKLSNELVFSGDVAQDWIAVRNLCAILQRLYKTITLKLLVCFLVHLEEWF